MKQDIWIEHAEKVEKAREAERERRREKNRKRKEKIAKTKCDNCGKFGATRMWFGSSHYHNSKGMVGFDKNLCEDCRHRFSIWYNIRTDS